MKTLCLILICIFTPCQFYGLGQEECTHIHNLALEEWNRSNHLIESANKLSVDDQAEEIIHFLSQAVACCQQAIHYCNEIINNYHTKTAEQKKEPWRKQIKETCEADNETFANQIDALNKNIADIHKQIAYRAINASHSEAEAKATLAKAKEQSCHHTIHNIEEVIANLNEVAKLFEEAAAILSQDLRQLSSLLNVSDKTFLENVVKSYNESARKYFQEALEYPKIVSLQKEALNQQLISLNQQLAIYEEQGLERRSYELKKEMVCILEQLIRCDPSNTALTQQLENLSHSLKDFELTREQNVFDPAISHEEYKIQEHNRRSLFFNTEPFANSFPQNHQYSSVIPLDGGKYDSDKTFSLFTDQFYRFLIPCTSPIPTLLLKVHEDNLLVHEEKIELPTQNISEWERFLIHDGMMHIPETFILQKYGIILRLNFNPILSEHALILTQKASSTNYSFSVYDENDELLYQTKFVPPPPWQLETLRKPVTYEQTKPLSHHHAMEYDLPNTTSKNGLELPASPLLDQFVEELKKDPLALAQYVQNEIDLWDPHLLQEDTILKPPRIIRSATTTFLEKKGSVWEQCMLLTYLLRQAGYQAHYLHGGLCSLPKTYLERLLLTTSLPKQENVQLDYPGVLFFDGDQWVPFFPWMQEVRIVEGYDLYHFMPEAYASADRWLQRYLANDTEILKYIGPDGDDTAGVLFTRFVEAELRKQGLSIQDVGIHRYPIKKQFSNWEDFPRPLFSEKSSWKTTETLENLPLFETIHITASLKENPHSHITITTSLPIPPLFLYCSRATDQSHFLHIKNGMNWHPLGILKLDSSNQEIEVNVSIPHANYQQTFSILKGASVAFCSSTGSANAQICSLAFEDFDKEPQEDKKLLKLLAFTGASYFAKCASAEQVLAALHKTTPKTVLACGLVTLSPESPNHCLDLKFPQVDMTYFSTYGNRQKLSFFEQQFINLFTATYSSNEHQIIKEVFQDPFAISTTKLLQIAHAKHQETGLPGLGFLPLTQYSFVEIEKDPHQAQALFFPYHLNLNLEKVIEQAKPQWEVLEEVLDSYAYAYITPGTVASQNGTDTQLSSYIGIGSLYFCSIGTGALISNGPITMSGGFGSPLPEGHLDYMFTHSWETFHAQHSSSFDFYPTTQTSFNPYFDPLKEPLYPSKPTLQQDFIPFLGYFDLTLLSQQCSADVRPTSKPFLNQVGDPVDIVSGAFYIDEIDLTLPGPFPLEIRRNYSSQNLIYGALGYGWKLSLNPIIIEDGDKLYAAEMDGTILVYRHNPKADRWEVFPEDNPDLTNFTQNGIGGTANLFHSYIQNDVLHSADGSKRFFKQGLLRKWEDIRGNTLTFSYDQEQLVEIASSNGSYCRFRYYSDGKISEIYVQDGRRVCYDYDLLGNLCTVHLPNEGHIRYDYDASHQIIRETKPSGETLENIFNEEGKVIKQRSPVGVEERITTSARFDYHDNKTIATNAAGHSTIYFIFDKQVYKIIDPKGDQILLSWFIDKHSWYDPEEECIKPWDQEGGFPKSLKSNTDKRGLKTSYLYDNRGNVHEIRYEGEDLTGTGTTLITKKLAYNDYNLCIQEETSKQKILTLYDQNFPYLPSKIETYFENTLTSYTDLTYNSKGQLERENRSGSVTDWKYDSYGFPSKCIQKTGTSDPDVITEYHFNRQGQCIKKITGDAVYETHYDIMGNPYQTFIRNLSGDLLSATYYHHNLSNQITFKQTANPQNNLFIDYNKAGQIKATRQELTPSGATAYTLYEYDTQGNLIEEVNPLGHSTLYTYDALEQLETITQEKLTTAFSYESGGKIASIVTPSGAQTTQSYTTNGLLKEEIFPDRTKNSTTYDVFGRPVQETKNGITWQTDYRDPTHQVIRTHVATQEQEVSTFDARGNLIQFQDAAGYTWETTYDCLNRIKSQTNPSGETTTWEYHGPHTTCTLPNGEKVIEQTAAEQVIQCERYNADDELIAKTTYEYDPYQDLEVLTEGDQVTLTYFNTYDQPIFIQQGEISTTYEYDPSGNCIAHQDGENQATRFTYDPLARLKTKTLPDGTHLKYEYDQDSNLEICYLPNNLTWKAHFDCMRRKTSEELQAQGKSTQKWEYHYRNGYLREIKDPLKRIHSYDYDSHGRLAKETVDNWERIYTYDPRGLLHTAEQTKSSWFWSNTETSVIQRTYDPSRRLQTENIYLNSNLIQQTHQTWSPKGRLLKINDHKRQLIYQNHQLIETQTLNATLAYDYHLDQTLAYKATPLSETSIAYHSSLPSQIETKLPNHSYQETLKWNPAGKLSHYQTTNGETTLTYHPNGHLKTLGSNCYAFDPTNIRIQAPNHSISSNGLDPFGRVLFETHSNSTLSTTYDEMGQIKTQNNRTFEWDPWGSLIAVSDLNLTWKATYDALGRRIQTYHTQSFTSQTITSFYDPEEEFQEIGIQTDNQTYWKLFGPNSCDAVTNDTETIYLTRNALGELTALITPNTTLYNNEVLIPYGPQNATPTTNLLSYAQSLNWHSKSPDPTGFIWMGARYYDPKTGRFLSPDPIGHPYNLNLYTFVNGDPINYFDPDGRFFIEAWHNPRVQGTLQTIGGISETVAGGMTAYFSAGFATPLGFAVMAHGLDHTITGLRAIVSGQYQDSATTQLLQKTGMSHNAASNVDAFLGFSGVTCSFKAFNAATRQTFPRFVWSIEAENISKTPYEIAKEGGRHAGFLKNNIFRRLQELEKSIVSLEKQIAIHKDKIANPSKYIPNWEKLHIERQKALINKKWPNEIQCFTEQKSILQEILNQQLSN